jgi:hypothetical protein
MIRARGVLAVVVVSSAMGCPAQAPVAPPPQPPPPAREEPVVWTLSKTGLGFRLTDADARDDKRPPPARAAKLSDADAKRVLDRLPPLKSDPGDEKPFALRDRSTPAPRSGATIVSAFPPPDAGGPPPAVTTPSSAPLTVTRKQPTGPVDLAPALTISFSQPMVAITSHDDLAKTPPPVVLTPTPPGKWRWVGAQTVVFDPDKRFPMATEYRVEVPAGTRAANGQTLAKAESWTFTTPTPTLKVSHPMHGPQGLDPLLYAEFDQAIDAPAVLAAAKLEGDGKPFPLRMATDDEISADPAVRLLSGKAQPGRWLAFRAKGKLPAATSFVVKFPEGTPSAEGPRRTTAEQRSTFFTYPPMRLSQATCNWGECAPDDPWMLFFSNPIDPSRFDASMVKIDPEPASFRVEASGNSVTIRPRSKGKTKYTITVDGALGDTFGQSLEKPASATLTVSPAEPFLFPEERDLSVVDPGGGSVLPVFSVNRPALDVRLYAVTPDDYPAYEKWRRDWDYEEKGGGDPPGRLVVAKRVAPENVADQLVTTPIDLAPALTDGVGQVLVVVEPPGKKAKNRWERQWVRAWVEVTKIGVQATIDRESVTAWCTDLASGAPLSGVEIGLGRGGTGVTTDATGLARVDLLPISTPYLVARRGKDLAFLPEAATSARYVPSDAARWLVFDDRHTYKPGEEVHLKGWIRKTGLAKGGDVGAIPNASGAHVGFVVHDARGVEIGKGDTSLDASGGFDLAFKLPATPNLGQATVRLEAGGLPVDGVSHTHVFDVQEFRRPEFEVTARAGEGPFFVGGHTNVTVAASYYAGGGLPNAEVGWKVFRADARFVPPNRADFSFGKAEDWWWRTRTSSRGKRGGEPETFPGRTGPSGEHRVRVDFDALDPAYPMNLRFEGTVTDVNRQAWTGTTNVLVHPAEVYVGVRQAKAFVKAGEPFGVDVLVADLDGKAVPGRPVKLRSARIDWSWQAGEPVEVESDVATCEVTSAAEAVPCSLTTKEGGRYRLTAVVTDRFERKNQTETHFWSLGDRGRADDTLERGKVEVIPSKASYAPGEVAELLVVAPFAPAEGLLTIRRQGVVHTSRFQLASTTEPIRVTVDPSWLPNATAHVALVGAIPRENARGVADPALPKKPAFAEGQATIRVPPRERTLRVSAMARDAKLDPGGSTTVDVEVRDAAGAPVAGSNAAVVVVDEAVLALSAYATPDPVAAFYADRSPDAHDAELRARVLVARPDDKRLRAKAEKSKSDGLHRNGGGGPGGGRYAMGAKKAAELPAPAPAARAMASAAPIAAELASLDMAMLGGLDAKASDPKKPIALRQEFGPLAVFAPTVTTDAAGRASVAVKLPDSLTRYRVMAVAVAGEKQFGSGEGSVTARLPLMVRPSAPRFLNFGDRFELPVVLQNQTDAPLEVDVAARAANAELPDGAGRRVTVPANDRVEVRLPAAAVKAGTARFQLGASSGSYADAAEVSLPVWTPATTEAFATYGTIDDGAVAQPVKMPSNVVTQFGGLEITTSSTALSALTDAVLYLVRYPFECNEQLSSRVLAVAALRDVLSAFNAKDMPSKEVLADSMKRDIEKLRARQHWSGGWDFWRSDREPWPYLSVHVTHALLRAKEKGYDVPKATLDGAQRYLRSIESHIPGWYSPESRRAIVAYALFVRKRMNDADAPRAKRLVTEAGGVDKLGLEAIGWIWPTLLDAAADAELADIRKHIQNRVSETAGAAHFATSYSDGAHVLLHSDRRADGILLDALIGDQPKSDLVPKLVTGLLAHRKAGHWLSTQENAFVLLALERYFATYEKATPDFVARAWLGDRYAGEHAFKGRSGDRSQIDVPMATMAEVGSADLVLAKQGTGRLYYRVGMTYAPSDLRPPPAEHGFTVTRQYEPVDDPGDVKRDADGTWRVKAGAKVRVRVTMVVPSRRYHVALVDPLPAGLEAMNPALATTGTVPQDPSAEPNNGVPWWWRSTWYEHQNLRDERVEAFASLVWDGVYDYTYVARATTPGTFVVPPPKAEEMYMPETFGRGAGDRLVVE